MNATQLPALASLVARAATATSYRRYTFDPDPTIAGRRETSLTVADATSLARHHFLAYPLLRSIQAEVYGAITLLQGNRHIQLEPGMAARPSLLTERQAEDLLLIAGVGARARVTALPGRGVSIDAGLHRIPPASSERLVEHGWVATSGEDGARVEVSLPGTVALAWRYCKSAGVSPGEWETEITEAVHGAYCA